MSVHILSLDRAVAHRSLDIRTVSLSSLHETIDTEGADYLIVHGGDGAVRRTCTVLRNCANKPALILNPTGSFNVLAKRHRIVPLDKILHTLASGNIPQTTTQEIYALNNEVFLFSAGNMGDMQHIFLSETLRFGILKKGAAKYLLAFVLLLPAHLLLTPFMLTSKRHFFIFTATDLRLHIGNIYTYVPEEGLKIEMEGTYHFVELDGDLVLIRDDCFSIEKIGEITIVKG